MLYALVDNGILRADEKLHLYQTVMPTVLTRQPSIIK